MAARALCSTLGPLLLALPLAAQAKVEFQRQILPIFEQRCVDCHATAAPGPDGKIKKPKGGVVLDSKDGITASLKGKLVVPSKSDASALYASISLPADHDDRMPPAKKGEPLTADQQALVRRWIDEGAAFGSWVGKKPEPVAAAQPDAAASPAKGAARAKVDAVVQLQQGVKALPAATLTSFASGPFVVASVGDNSPLLAVSCRGNADTIDDKALQALTPIASHVTELDLARTHVGDDGCKLLATMPLLTSLDLRQTQVGNTGVAALAACKELRSLNLFGTKVGDYAATALATCKKLEQLYVWQTDVTATAAVRLRESIPGLRVVMTADLPEPMPEGQGGQRRRR
ncbi:MAG: hypothetical protein JNK15_18755 [Planctomycetes bacterium]|nr:hypothetical protein [Planctomycetota bacterium]